MPDPAVGASDPTMMPSAVAAYVRNRALSSWSLAGDSAGGVNGVVVIPAYAEEEHLFATLASLAANPAEYLDRFLILVVVNNRADVPTADLDNNAATLRRLDALGDRSPLRLAWVDAASPGRELPPGGGVGLARKIGLDLALKRLDYTFRDPLLICLDADTIVRPDYLSAIDAHFAEARDGGSVIPFCHQAGESPVHDEAIVNYELFLRSYVLGLSLAGSPYAFHTVGSAMACRASAYVRAGGMNGRMAGEDFYFLQQLRRTSGVAELSGTVVFPSARSSHRVPFGTGRSISRSLGGDPDAVAFYRTECFAILGAWLALVTRELGSGPCTLLAAAASISPYLAEYLSGSGFSAVWERLQRHNPRPVALLAAFHGWFDALRTMKLIHHLSSGPYPRCGAQDSVPPLLGQAGLPDPGKGGRELLGVLRRAQIGASCPHERCSLSNCVAFSENFPPEPGPCVV
ncbi:MAG TPA: hypothetical protein VI389_06125 [Geobacteraceae bacterium]